MLLLPKANPSASVSDLSPCYVLRDQVMDGHFSIDTYPPALNPGSPISTQCTHKFSFLERNKKQNPSLKFSLHSLQLSFYSPVSLSQQPFRKGVYGRAIPLSLCPSHFSLLLVTITKGLAKVHHGSESIFWDCPAALDTSDPSLLPVTLSPWLL